MCGYAVSEKYMHYESMMQQQIDYSKEPYEIPLSDCTELWADLDKYDITAYKKQKNKSTLWRSKNEK